MENAKIYARKHYLSKSPVGWMTGVEGFRVVSGRLVTFVLLQDGSVEPLSDLLVMADKRSEEREKVR
jgi:hypothetical protein